MKKDKPKKPRPVKDPPVVPLSESGGTPPPPEPPEPGP